MRPLAKRWARPPAAEYSAPRSRPTTEVTPPMASQRRWIGDDCVLGEGVGEVAGAVDPEPKRNQLERRPNLDRKASPVSVTSALEPSSFSCSTRPYQSPWPSRRVTRTRLSVPRDGYALWMALLVTVVVQVCT